MRLLRPRKRNRRVRANPKPELDVQVTECCESQVEMRRVGNELFVVCSKCSTHIGHVVIRPVAVLSTHFAGFLLKAAQQRQMSLRFSPLELDEMFETYIQYLTDWAPEAARQTLRDYVPAEEPIKEDDKR